MASPRKPSRRRASDKSDLSIEEAVREQERELRADRVGTLDPATVQRGSRSIDTTEIRGLSLHEVLDNDAPEPAPPPRMPSREGSFVPSGSEWWGGTLVVPKTIRHLKLTEVDRDAFYSVLFYFHREIVGGSHKGEPRALLRSIERAAAVAAQRRESWTEETRDTVYATFEAIKGHPPGQDWRKQLTWELENAVRLRHEAREQKIRRELPKFVVFHNKPMSLRKVPHEREPGEYIDEMFDGPPSASRVLDRVKRFSRDPVPRELTVRVIDAAIDGGVTLGGAGGRRGGKSAARWVADFAEALTQKRPRKLKQ